MMTTTVCSQTQYNFELFLHVIVFFGDIHTAHDGCERCHHCRSGGLEELGDLERRLYEIAHVKKVVTKPQCDISYTADVDSLTSLLLEGGAYTVVPHRSASEIRTCDGKDTLATKESNSCSLYAIVVTRRDTAATCVKNETSYKWAGAIPISEREVKEGVVAMEEDPESQLHRGDEEIAQVRLQDEEEKV